MQIENRLKKISDFILNVLFPIYCLKCGKENPSFICGECFEGIEISIRNCCPICETQNESGSTCPACEKTSFIEGIISASDYNNLLIQKAVKTYKFSFARILSKELSSLITKKIALSRPRFFNEFDFLIPVPLHIKRLNWRGFNQAELIAKELSDRFNVPIKRDILIRVKNTKPQSKLKTEKERKKNIEGAFLVNKKSENSQSLRNKSILLIDDVCATASTLDECARILRQAGAKKVWGAVAARGK